MQLFTPKVIAMGQTIANKVIYDGKFTITELQEMMSDIFNEARKRPEMFTWGDYD